MGQMILGGMDFMGKVDTITDDDVANFMATLKAERRPAFLALDHVYRKIVVVASELSEEDWQTLVRFHQNLGIHGLHELLHSMAVLTDNEKFTTIHL